MSAVLKIADMEVKPGTRAHAMLQVTRTLRGDLAVPVHVVKGAESGPVFALLCNVHGDETMPFLAAHALWRSLDPSRMRGSVVILPVSNPLAFSDFRRESHEQRENTDLHRCYPGNPRGSVTEMIAKVIGDKVLAHVDALTDLHSGGAGRIHQRVDLNEDASGSVRERSMALCRSFGAGVVHANFLPPSCAVGHLNGKGGAASGVEIGGAYLSAEMTDEFVKRTVRGLENQLMHLGILEGTQEAPKVQYLFTRKERKESNPTRGGYVVSNAQSIADLGRRVRKGEKLGVVIDPYTMETSEELNAPCDGILFFSRVSGPAEAGAKGFAVADASGLKEI
jgi:predicted deacylase